MADWKTYAKAARNTARRQAQSASRPARDRPDPADRNHPRPPSNRSGRDRARDDAPRRRTLSTGDYARAARRALDEGTRESRDSLRRSSARARKDAAAYAVVAERRMRRAQVGRRVTAAFRDAVLMGLSLFIIWFVVTRTGVQIPFTAVLAVVGVIVVVRFGWALAAQFTTQHEAGPEDVDDEPREYEPTRDPRDASAAPRTERQHRSS
ncbi:hypothetical protein [Brachybacterium epidermidis]|uniref:hypothetical protein n=1 Tax=Brachybacterium epidermidis TaxID=2781983 RepID=UPI00398F59F9